MKKLTALVLALLLCCSLFACTQTAAPVSEGGGEQPAAADGETASIDLTADAGETDSGEGASTSALPHELVSERLTSGDYQYDSYSDGTATVTRYNGSDTELVIPSELDGMKVTAIGGAAFQARLELTNVTIPDGVTEIGDFAFDACSKLASVTIPQSVTVIGEGAFHWCAKLTSIAIPEGVREIQTMTFAECYALSEITLPTELRGIGCGAFLHTEWLAAQPQTDGWIELGGGLRYVYAGDADSVTVPEGKEKFDFCINWTVRNVVIPAGMTAIDASAFNSCTELASVTIPDSVTAIGNDAFSNCRALTDVTIPGSVQSIGARAFSGCVALASVTIPDGVTRIGKWAFAGCYVLESVTIPDSVTEIGDYAFGSCPALTVLCPEGGYAWTYATENNIPCKAA